jgi:hypothetical protein
MSNESAARLAGGIVEKIGHRGENPEDAVHLPAPKEKLNVDLDAPLAALNVGLESFAESLHAQEGQVIHVRWKPPAGGNDRLMGILERMKG